MDHVKQCDGAAIGDAFSDACLNLLFRLESLLSILGEGSERHHQDECLDAAKQLLMEFLDFAEREFADPGDSIFERLQSVYRSTKSLEHDLHQTSWSNIKSILGMRGDVSIESNQLYLELGKMYADLSTEFFDRCKPRLSNSPMRQGLTTSMDLFIQELLQRW